MVVKIYLHCLNQPADTAEISQTADNAYYTQCLHSNALPTADTASFDVTFIALYDQPADTADIADTHCLHSRH